MSDASPSIPPEINGFRIVVNDEMQWREADIGLPPGVRHKLLHLDPTTKRRVSKVSFPPGYIEPEHTHQGWHSVLVVKGRMCVAGKDLPPGSYIFGWDIPHGPFEYPDGCEVFTVSMGEDMHHHWNLDEFLAYQRQWEPKTEDGRHGCAEFDRWRQAMRSAKGKA